MDAETEPQPDGVIDQFTVVSLPPLLLIAAVIAPEVLPSVTVVESGVVIDKVSASIVKVALVLMLGLTVEAAVIVALQFAARVVEGGVKVALVPLEVSVPQPELDTSGTTPRAELLPPLILSPPELLVRVQVTVSLLDGASLPSAAVIVTAPAPAPSVLPPLYFIATVIALMGTVIAVLTLGLSTAATVIVAVQSLLRLAAEGGAKLAEAGPMGVNVPHPVAGLRLKETPPFIESFDTVALIVTGFEPAAIAPDPALELAVICMA